MGSARRTAPAAARWALRWSWSCSPVRGVCFHATDATWRVTWGYPPDRAVARPPEPPTAHHRRAARHRWPAARQTGSAAEQRLDRTPHEVDEESGRDDPEQR